MKPPCATLPAAPSWPASTAPLPSAGTRWPYPTGKPTDKLETPWDQPVTPELVEAALRQKHYEIITIVHNETSTGLQNPVQEIAAAGAPRQPGHSDLRRCRLFAGRRQNRDGCLGTGHAADFLAEMPGAAARPGACAPFLTAPWPMPPACRNRGWYFDLVRMEKHRLKDSTPATPALSLIYALDVQLDRILAEGIGSALRPLHCHGGARPDLGDSRAAWRCSPRRATVRKP